MNVIRKRFREPFRVLKPFLDGANPGQRSRQALVNDKHSSAQATEVGGSGSVPI